MSFVQIRSYVVRSHLKDETMNKKLLNLAQAADYLGVPHHTLHNLFYRRSNKTQPKPSYLGSRLFFHPDNLDELAVGNVKTLS